MVCLALYGAVLNGQLPATYADQEVPLRFKGRVALNKPHNFKEKVIALTFDDGPDPTVTPLVLQSLKDADAKATFFVIGRYAAKYPELVKAAADRGHVVGNHTWDHAAHPSQYWSGPEIWKTSRAIYDATGRWPSVFRPPYGIQTSLATKRSQREGYGCILWNVVGPDTVKRPSSKNIASWVLSNAKPGDVVLFHDGPGKMYTAEALPVILKGLKDKGFTMVTVPDMLRKWDWQFAQNQAKQKQAKAKSKTGSG